MIVCIDLYAIWLAKAKRFDKQHGLYVKPKNTYTCAEQRLIVLLSNFALKTLTFSGCLLDTPMVT